MPISSSQDFEFTRFDLVDDSSDRLLKQMKQWLMNKLEQLRPSKMNVMQI